MRNVAGKSTGTVERREEIVSHGSRVVVTSPHKVILRCDNGGNLATWGPVHAAGCQRLWQRVVAAATAMMCDTVGKF